MNFIYDIVLNFNKEYYYFYEWNKKDNIISIKKIPLFLIDNDTFNILRNDNVIVDKAFIDIIKDKTYTYTRCKIGIACLVSNGREALGLLFNDKGNLIKRSSLILDEEEEVLEEALENRLYNINIIKHTKIKNDGIIRSVKEKRDFLISYINREKSPINLKYLYYDYFENDEDDIDCIKKSLIYEIKNNWNNKFNDFYETVKMFSKIKN